MKMALIQKLCRSLQTPAFTKRYWDAVIGLGLIFGCQLLVIPTQLAFDLHSINIPASILVMLFLFFAMTIASSINKDVADFYNKYLRGPTDFVGRHMSLGFVAFFILLIQDHIQHASDIPKLAGAFVVTTIVGYVFSYLLAYGGFHLESRIRQRKRPATDLESNNKTWPAASPERRPVVIKRLSTLSEAFSASEPLRETKTISYSLALALVDMVFKTAPIWICLFLLTAIGLPVYLATGYMMPFDLFSITLLWVISVQFQRSLRSWEILLRFKRSRALILIFCNPILLTWALGTAYMWAKATCAGRSIEFIIKDFHHFSSLSKCIVHIMQDHDVPAHLGAGDLASLLLDAGVACMGFKMYEYRSELWASLGTVSFTCTALAAINVFLNIIVAHACGLQAAEAVAFAGRSATLALGIPAIENIHGSTTLASTIAVFSGIVFQMAGDWLFSVLRINDRAPRGSSTPPPKVPILEKSRSLFSKATSNRHTEEKQDTNNACAETNEESSVVAAGVTVGINAAAMGTAYLIERDSRAVAYSALSMILFGAITVGLTAIPATTSTIAVLTSR
ncbi:hypothetical protein F5B22DRAFT_16527 [Xylaria bambusicola]|uniref:uncharacterized protein n=1 Tax=Xylaria bambusicola TaxID=326684 RepID=UPI002007D3C7|nr:uncharacterized protein F5B22DRAFT_16527 [Xylaria bambusicola]KAI0528032.1 hypothetical protein F5B22DRAFT_16527 [Xylaria bambusicola]